MVTGNATEQGAKRPLTASDVDEIPLTLGVQEMSALFGMSLSRFAQLEKQGRWDRFKLKNPIGRKKYSGVLVRAHFRGGK
jgi:hypothetical protein